MSHRYRSSILLRKLLRGYTELDTAGPAFVFAATRTGRAVVTGYAPTTVVSVSITLGTSTGAASVAGFAPTVGTGSDVLAAPVTGVVSVAGFAAGFASDIIVTPTPDGAIIENLVALDAFTTTTPTFDGATLEP